MKLSNSLFFKLRSILRPIKYLLKRPPDSFLNDISGVVHVGANLGQEREGYNHFGLQVLWVEPIPVVFSELERNIKGFHKQRAFQELVSDIDGKQYEFHVSNHNGRSSSILELKQHKDIWPDVNFVSTISLKSVTLVSLFEREKLDPRNYQALVLDTQGSELLVLQGCVPLLEGFKYIKTEVADFESYKGCCQLADLNKFLEKYGYIEFSRRKFASRTSGGSYFDIVYKKKARSSRI